MKAKFPSAVAILATLFVLWSLAAPWAAAFPSRADHYKVSLFGVRHIADMTASATETRCGWNDSAAECQPAAGGRRNYVLLSRARWLVLTSVALAIIGVFLLRRVDLRAPAALSLVAAALFTGLAILLVRANVSSALAVVAGAQVSLSGSGITAATIFATLATIAAGLTAAPHNVASTAWRQA